MTEKVKFFLIGAVAGIVVLGGILATQMNSLMFTERESPFGLMETVARIQRNIESVKGWKLVGLRSPSNSIRAEGAWVPEVVLIETCNTDYSKPILKQEDKLTISILIPCKIAVYKKSDGKVYIGSMNAGLMGWFFGWRIGRVMSQVAADQKKFFVFDPSRPAPKVKIPAKNKAKGGKGGIGGC